MFFAITATAYAEDGGATPLSPEVSMENSKSAQRMETGGDLANQTLNFVGEGSASFGFDGKGAVSMTFTNYGTQNVYYKVQYPFGDYLLGSANSGNTLLPGATMTYSHLDMEGLHGSDAFGAYTVFMYNDDGSSGSFGMVISRLDDEAASN